MKIESAMTDSCEKQDINELGARIDELSERLEESIAGWGLWEMVVMAEAEGEELEEGEESGEGEAEMNG